MKKMRISRILGIALAFLMIGVMFGTLPSTASASEKFNIGDTIEVCTSVAVSVYVFDAPCGNLIGWVWDGDRGVVVDGPVHCNFHNHWLIRWSDGLEGWSHEDRLEKVSPTPTPTLMPDLMVDYIWIEPATFHPGDAVMLWQTTKNIGNGDAVGQLTVKICFDGTPVMYSDRDGLAAGGSFTTPTTYTWPSDTNWHTIKVVVDPDDFIAESNEENNERSEQFRAATPTPSPTPTPTPTPTPSPDDMPLIESLTPSFGIPGTEVIIEGKNFGSRGDWPYDPYCYVKFGKSLAGIISWEDTKIVVEAPSDYGTGVNDAGFLTKIISYAIGGFWGKVIGILTDLFIPGVALAPSEDGILEDVTVATAAGISNKAAFTWKVPTNVEASYLDSPGELRVYDSQYNVTGLVNGEVKEEIPHSHCYENGVIIFYPTGSYTYEVVGTDEGSYDVTVTKVTEEQSIAFTATDTPTSTNAVHQYTIDWDALSQGEKGVTMQIDSDGDGTFERTEYLSATGEEGDKGGTDWPIIAAVAGGIVIVALAFWAIARRRRAA